MNCYYCHKPCLQTPTLDEASHLTYWKCQNGCSANFNNLEDGRSWCITWGDICLSEHYYFIKLYSGVTANGPTFIVSCTVKDPVHWTEIIRWDFIPESWTPQNVREKLKTFLPFI
jgi:hypothetical protein